MSGRAVELSVAGTSCRVVTTADDAELAALCAMVEEKLAAVLKSGRPVTKQAVLLAAIALAHDAREQRARADAIAARAKQALGRVLAGVDEVLAQTGDRREPERRKGVVARVEVPRRAHDKERGQE